MTPLEFIILCQSVFIIVLVVRDVKREKDITSLKVCTLHHAKILGLFPPK